MPWRRKAWLRQVLQLRDTVAAEQRDREEHEADQAKVQEEHNRRLAAMGLNPDGTKLGG